MTVPPVGGGTPADPGQRLDPGRAPGLERAYTAARPAL